MGGWYFITVPVEISDDIKQGFGDMTRGWGSLPVIVKVGVSNWKTSIFPDKKAGAYILPVKSEIRKKESIKEGDKIELTIEINV